MKSKSEQMAIQAIVNQPAGMLNALHILSLGGKIHLAVDFSEVAAYAIPDVESLLCSDQRSSLDYCRKQIVLTYLFEQYRSDFDEPLFFLPPYQQELDDAILFFRKLSLDEEFRFEASDLVRDFTERFLVDNDIVKILGKNMDTTVLSNEDKGLLLRLLKKNYMKLHTVLTLRTKRAAQELGNQKRNTSLKNIDPKTDERFQISTDGLDEKAIRWKKAIEDRRWRSTNQANYRDGQAWEYLIRINERLAPRGQAMVLVTRSPFDSWTSVEPIEVIVKGQQYSVPRAFDPKYVFSWLISTERATADGRIDYERTIENLGFFAERQEDLEALRIMVQESELPPVRASRDPIFKRLDRIGRKMESCTNLKAALTMLDKRSFEPMERLIKRTEKVADKSYKDFAGRFRQLYEVDPSVKTKLELF